MRMCVCFHGEEINRCLKYIQNASCKEHLVFSNRFLSWLCQGKCRTLPRHSADPVLQFNFSGPSSITHHQAMYSGECKFK